MILEKEIAQNTMIIVLDKVYSNKTISDIISLSKSEEFSRCSNIAVDCTKLVAIDSMGPELFLLRQKLGKEARFCLFGLKKEDAKSINDFGEDSGHKAIPNFSSKKEALEYIKS